MSEPSGVAHLRSMQLTLATEPKLKSTPGRGGGRSLGLRPAQPPGDTLGHVQVVSDGGPAHLEDQVRPLASSPLPVANEERLAASPAADVLVELDAHSKILQRLPTLRATGVMSLQPTTLLKGALDATMAPVGHSPLVKLSALHGVHRVQSSQGGRDVVCLLVRVEVSR